MMDLFSTEESKAPVANVIISSRDNADDLIAEHKPRAIVSILDDDELRVKVDDSVEHIKLSGQCTDPNECEASCQTIIKLAEECAALPGDDWSVLFYCNEGVCRSTAFATVFICALEKTAPESEIAERLRKMAPHADPNMMVVAKADSLLNRNDRMIDALLDLSPCSPGATTPSVILPVAA